MIADIIILFINLLITLATGIITWIVNILPTSPFSHVSFDIPNQYLGYVNYFLPINLMLPVLMAWASMFAAYKFIKWILHILRIE